MYEQFSTRCATFIATHPPVDVDGEAFGLPGIVVYRSSIHKLAGKGRIEMNRVAPEAATTFEWQTEITINDKANGIFVHALLRPNHSVVETYGKTIHRVSPERAEEIYALLEELLAA